MITEIQDKINKILYRLSTLKAEEKLLSSELKVLNQQLADCDKKIPVIPLSNYSVEDKINIFMSLFRGRADVFAKRWENLKNWKTWLFSCMQ